MNDAPPKPEAPPAAIRPRASAAARAAGAIGLGSPIRAWPDGLALGRRASLLAFVLCVALVLRLGWLLVANSVPVSDAGGYEALALSLARGQGYSLDGHPTAWWVPGWPAFVAALYAIFGPYRVVVYAANLLLGLALVALTYVLGRRLFGTAVGLVAAGAMAVYPNFVVLPRYFLTENLALPAMLALLLLALEAGRRRRFLLANGLAVGLVGGLVVLVREQTLVVLPAIALYWLVRQPIRRAVPLCLGLCAGLLLAVGPWIARNETVVGVPWLATTSGINLYVAFNPQAAGGWENPPYQTWVTGQGPTPEAEMYFHGRDAARRYVLENPGAVIALAPARLRYLLAEEWAVWWEQGPDQQLSVSPWLATWVVATAFMMHLVLMACAVIALRKRPWSTPEALLPLFVIAFTLAMLALVYGMGRLHAPLEPLLAILMAFGLCRAARSSTASRRVAESPAAAAQSGNVHHPAHAG